MAKLFDKSQQLLSNRDDRCKILYEKLTQQCIELINNENSHLSNSIIKASRAGGNKVDIDTGYSNFFSNLLMINNYQQLNTAYKETIIDNGCSLENLNHYLMTAKNKTLFNVKFSRRYGYGTGELYLNLHVSWPSEENIDSKHSK